MTSTTSKLFEPVKLGNLTLQHRIVMAPMTRYKADDAHVPFLPLVSDYYAERASTPGTLLITEATFIAARAGGYAHIPGIWSADQIAAWKTVGATPSPRASRFNITQRRSRPQSTPKGHSFSCSSGRSAARQTRRN
jgi:NADPH2 dehydrogenase